MAGVQCVLSLEPAKAKRQEIMIAVLKIKTLFISMLPNLVAYIPAGIEPPLKVICVKQGIVRKFIIINKI